LLDWTEGFGMVTKTCDLVERMKAIPDPRRRGRNLKHRLEDIRVLGFLGTLAGGDDFVEIADWAADNRAFLGTFLEVPHGNPPHAALNGVFALGRADALQAVLLPWLLERRGLPGDWVHVDGKTLRHTRRASAGLGAPCTWSAPGPAKPASPWGRWPWRPSPMRSPPCPPPS